MSLISQVSAAEWTDVFDGSTHDGSALLTMDDGHTYRPTNAAAWSGAITLPATAKATVAAPSVSGFGGNTYTTLTFDAGGALTLYGADGHAEVITSFVKEAKGLATLYDRTSGGLTVSGFTANNDAAVSDITIKAFGAGTTINLTDDMSPVGTASPLTLDVDAAAVVTLTTITTLPTLKGTGRLILGSTLRNIPLAQSPRLAAFKGRLTTDSGGTTDIAFTADSYVFTLSGVTEIPYSVIKLMKGTVRLPASTTVTF